MVRISLLAAVLCCCLAQAEEAKVVLHQGETATLTRPCNPTTGFNWYVESAPDDGVAQVETSYVAEQTELPLCDSGGETRITIKGLTPGETTAALVYKRAWEKDIPPAETYTIHITVEP